MSEKYDILQLLPTPAGCIGVHSYFDHARNESVYFHERPLCLALVAFSDDRWKETSTPTTSVMPVDFTGEVDGNFGLGDDGWRDCPIHEGGECPGGHTLASRP